MSVLVATRTAAAAALAVLCIEPCTIEVLQSDDTYAAGMDVKVSREMTGSKGGAPLDYDGRVGPTYTVWLPRASAADVGTRLTFVDAPTKLEVIDVLPMGMADPKKRVIAKVRA